MLKFFRTLRKKLIEQDNVRKPASPAGRYLVYAIGEIALVMIGILIAENLAPPDSYRDLKPDCRTGRGEFSIFEL